MEIRQVKENGEPVQLLWTGGWDSTFRMLQLAIVLKKRIQPHYIVTVVPARNSLQAEISTMARIKRAMFQKFPYTKDLVLPTIYTGMDDIPIYPDIRDAMNKLRKTCYFGDQYDIFSEYTRWKQIPYLELGVYALHGHFTEKNELLVRVETELDHWYEIDIEKAAASPYRSFSFARLPFMGESKLKLKDKAKEYGFLDLMHMTWFCYEPKKTKQGIVPCGCCQVCRETMIDGMPERIAWLNRLQGWWVWKFIEIRRLFKQKIKK